MRLKGLGLGFRVRALGLGINPNPNPKALRTAHHRPYLRGMCRDHTLNVLTQACMILPSGSHCTG